MKKLLFASLLSAAVMFAQTGGGTTDKVSKEPNTKTTAGKKATKEHKGGHKLADKDKKGKKGSTDTTTTPPPK